MDQSKTKVRLTKKGALIYKAALKRLGRVMRRGINASMMNALKPPFVPDLCAAGIGTKFHHYPKTSCLRSLAPARNKNDSSGILSLGIWQRRGNSTSST